MLKEKIFQEKDICIFFFCQVIFSIFIGVWDLSSVVPQKDIIGNTEIS